MPRLVLVQPKIPPNTGNVARTCAATGTELHLVGPLGFEITDRYLKRAGLDYWPHVKLHYHADLPTFWANQAAVGGRLIGFDTDGTDQKTVTDYHKLQYEPEDWLLFGSETVGLSLAVLDRCDHIAYIPMASPHVRSLNLSVSAAIGLFEVYRQLGDLDRFSIASS